MHPAREDIRPAVVAVDGGGGPVGDRVAECHDRLCSGGCAHIDRVEEIPRGRGIWERLFRLVFCVGAAARRADIGRAQCLGVPGHWPAVPGDVERDRQTAPGQYRVVRVVDEGQRHRVADGVLSGGDSDAGLAAEGDRTVGPGQDRAAALLEADMDGVEGDGFGAESVGQADARLLAPDVRPDDQTERLIRRALRRVREREPQFGLRGGVANGVGTLRRGRPGDHEVGRGGLRGRQRGKHQWRGQKKRAE